MGLLDKTHGAYVHTRRVRVLAGHFAGILPTGAQVLDVGCGDGMIAAAVMGLRPDVKITGVDVLVRPETAIPVIQYDGKRLPFADRSFDAATFSDVLHHTDDPLEVMREAARVASYLIIKDHLRDGLLAETTLRFMDYIGNERHGVRLPYNYLSEREWRASFSELGLVVDSWVTQLGLYPFPASLIFERGMHFVSRLICPSR